MNKFSFYLKKITDDLQTKKGREDILGIKANRRDRKYREQAVTEFISTYPEFWIINQNKGGHTYDFDGYIQTRIQNDCYCEFFEGKRNVEIKFDEKSSDPSISEINYRIIGEEEIPVVRNLLTGYKNWEFYREKYSTSLKYMYASCWFHWVGYSYSDSKDIQQHKANLIALVVSCLKNLISNKKLPVNNIEELFNSSEELQMLFLSKVLKELNIEPLIPEINWKDFNDEDILITTTNENIWQGHQYEFWHRVLRYKFRLMPGLLDTNLRKLFDT